MHRDLKPGNVLVTPDGQVKLLDFGIAKALDPVAGLDGAGASANDTTLGTVRPFTPNYASPKQVRGEPISTATDIYSLGVLLNAIARKPMQPQCRPFSRPISSPRIREPTRSLR